ncbi:LemA family protein [Blautia faecis]|uniref:LemA family protein n=1 Tax=Blautia faecis TaxID=871665 RepID=UPI001D013D9D|nr:LemA family protein [Blautia faecis]
MAYVGLYYNDSVNKYINQREVFPSVLIAKIFGFGTFDYFEVQETDKEVPKVKF